MKNQSLDRKFRIAGSLSILLIFAMVGCKPQAVATSTAVFSETLAPVLTATPLPTNTAIIFTPTSLPAEIIAAKDVVMRLVPAGPFTMGSSNGMPDEKPVHTIDLPAFYMDKYEVTNAFYKVCVNAGVCQVPANTGSGIHPGAYGTYGDQQFDNYPVIWVDWNRAKTYCEWRGARLPSETEWEKAARGTDGNKYPWGEVIDPTFANYGSNVPDDYGGVFGKTTAVGSYPKGQSPYGVYDMAGNVWEWTADWYDMYPGGDPSANIAFGQKTYRVLRGGAWSDDPDQLRATFRGGNTPETTVNYIGFRCARTFSLAIQKSTSIDPIALPTSTPVASTFPADDQTLTAGQTQIAPATPIRTPIVPVQVEKFPKVYIQDGNVYYRNSESQSVQLTNSGKDRDPILSDDGQKIIFFRAESIDKMYSINSDGSMEKALVTGKTSLLSEKGEIKSPTFVPGSHLVLFNTYLCSPSKGLYIYPECVIGLYGIDADTREINKVIENIHGNSQRDRNFEVSPDGKYVSVAGAGNIKIYSLSSGEYKIAYPNIMSYYVTSNSEYLPKQYWLPDSSGLIIIRAADGEGNDPASSPFFYDIFRYNIGEEQAAQLQLDKYLMHDYQLDTWCISPDRNWILFTGNESGSIGDDSLSNYLGNLTDGHTQGFDNLFLDLESCKWSPDSKHFYTSSDKNNIIGSIDGPLIPVDGSFMDWIDSTHYYYTIGEKTYIGAISGN